MDNDLYTYLNELFGTVDISPVTEEPQPLTDLQRILASPDILTKEYVEQFGKPSNADPFPEIAHARAHGLEPVDEVINTLSELMQVNLPKVLAGNKILPLIRSKRVELIETRISMIEMVACEDLDDACDRALANVKKLQGTMFFAFAKTIDYFPDPSEISEIIQHANIRQFQEYEIDRKNRCPLKDVFTYEVLKEERARVKDYLKDLEYFTKENRMTYFGQYDPLTRYMGEVELSKGDYVNRATRPELYHSFPYDIQFSDETIQEIVAEYLKRVMDAAIMSTYNDFIECLVFAVKMLQRHSETLCISRRVNEVRNLANAPTAVASDVYALCDFLNDDSQAKKFIEFITDSRAFLPFFQRMLKTSKNPERTDIFGILYRACFMLEKQQRMFIEHFKLYPFLLEETSNRYPEWTKADMLYVAVRTRHLLCEMVNYFASPQGSHRLNQNVTADYLCSGQYSTLKNVPAFIQEPYVTEFNA